MCGITGLYHLNGQNVEKAVMASMTDALKHRGPDDEALWVDGPVGLGHRRLSIIDLSPRGRNPMSNEDGTIWITFNGEIYNYKDFKSDLLNKGHQFRSKTDTEIIIHLYEEIGPACIEKLNGMFTFGLWDGRRNRLLLARDRFGVKPLYYTRVGDTLAFASEVKAFLQLPGFNAQADFYGLAEHFTFQNMFGARTMFKDVHLLPAGHYLICENGRIEQKQYWDLQFEPDDSLTMAEWAAGLRERFEAAVTRQLMSDVPLGTYLSGGMDTGSITAVATRHIPNMHTFTCGFDLPQGASSLEQYFDERQASRDLADLFDTIHHELILGPKAMASVLPTVVWHLDEPRVGISYQVYRMAEVIRRHVTVVLSGVGGDELFAGYPWRYQPIIDSSPEQFDSVYYQQWIRFLTDDEKKRFFTERVNHELNGYSTFDSYREVMNSADKSWSPLHRALYFDFKTFLNGLLLVDDKLSMAHSVEGRVPFLDNDLVNYVARMPSGYKLNGGQGKAVLRKAMNGLLPDETINRRKQGFTPPDRTWYKEESWDYIQQLILSERAVERQYFRPDYLKKILNDHLHDRRNNRFLIWSLMCFEWWNRLFVDGDVVPSREALKEVPVGTLEG